MSLTQLDPFSHPAGWRFAIYASVILWVAIVVGNIALFTIRPASHWPVLETIETLQVASLIPVALILHRLNRPSPLSLWLTGIGIAAMLLGIAIDIGFATASLSYGNGIIGGPAFYACELIVLAWLLGANLLGWRIGTLPRGLAALGMATAVTATLLYPVWAIWLFIVLLSQRRQREGCEQQRSRS